MTKEGKSGVAGESRAMEDRALPLDALRRFDRAVTLFNAGEFYEAHEDWELLWLDAEGDERLWLQGLIQYAAAFVHFARGFYASGFHRLMAGATEKVAGYTGRTWSIHWPECQRTLAPWIAHGRAVAEGADLTPGPADTPVPQLTWAEGHQPDPLPLEDVQEM